MTEPAIESDPVGPDDETGLEPPPGQDQPEPTVPPEELIGEDVL